MSTFKSGTYLKGAIYRPTSLGDALEIVSTITLHEGQTLALNDQLLFCKVGENVRIQDFVLESDELDTGSTISLDLGVPGTPKLLLSASPVGRAGGEAIRRSTDATADNAFATTPYVPVDAVRTIVGTVSAAPAGNPATVRNISLKLKLFFTPGELQLVGLDSSDNKVYQVASVNTYNGLVD